MLKPEFEAIFFDFDGVLILSEPLHFKSWQTVLKNNNLNTNFLKFEDVLGMADDTIAKKIKKNFSLEKSIEELLEEKTAFYVKESKKSLSYPKGRNKFLKYVKQNGYILAIVSNSSRFEIESILKMQKIDTFFEFIISANDCKKTKPDPMPYQMALSKANVKPSKALAIEDSCVGIRSAKSANIFCYQLNNPKFKQRNVPYFEDFNSLLNAFFKDKHYK